jgi:glycosyltransferase involved in cell wall biosynthesis
MEKSSSSSVATAGHDLVKEYGQKPETQHAFPNLEFHSWLYFSFAEPEFVRVDGWVVREDQEIKQIRVIAYGKKWYGYYGIPRRDVGQAFPHLRNAAFSGLALRIPRHADATEIVLEAQNSAGRWETFFRDNIRFPRTSPRRIPTLAEKARKVFRREDSAPIDRWEGLGGQYVCWVDEPLDWRKIARRFRLSGWCFSKAGETIHAIRARVGGREFPGNYGLFRADVAAAYDERPGAFKSGFDIVVEAPRRKATLFLDAQKTDGSWKEVFSRQIRAPLISLRASADRPLWQIGNYAEWIKRYDTLRLTDRRKIKAHIRIFPKRPLISVIMPVYNPTAEHLETAIKSVRAQLYPDWELCIVDDASPSRHVQPILRYYEKLDRRIKVCFRQTNGGIATASNEALGLTSGEYVALLDDDDELAPTALYFIAHEINQHPSVQLIYSDEDKLDVSGQRTNAHFKTDWNGQLFLAQNFFSHLGVFRSKLIKQLGFRPDFDGSQDYDLVLRCAEKLEPRQIRHIPRVLYHWRMSAQSAALNFHAKPHARAAAIRAVQEHFERRTIAAEVMSSGDEDFRRIRYSLPTSNPSVSIIIPTRDMVDVLRPCLQSILERTNYPRFEIIVIDNQSRDSETSTYLAEIAQDARVRILSHDSQFNYGRLNNFGVNSANSDFVALLNNDLAVIDPDWLREMVSQGIQPGVAAVGARLLYPDNRLQHGGVIIGGGGVAAHAHKGLPPENHGYFARAILAQELSAVTAACMLVRRNAYLEVRGFDEEYLRVAFNDVDFCLRLLQRGYRIIYTPYAQLYHFESASRGLEDTVSKHERFVAEIAYMKKKWADVLLRDPHYNPNLSLEKLFTLAFPPRLSKPWAAI